MRCPACHANCRILRTKVITDYLRDITHCCKNRDCGHVFVTQQEFIRSIVEPTPEADEHSSANA